MLRDVCRHCESWTAGLERMIRDEVVTGGESAQGTHTVGDLGERRVTLGFKAVVPAAGAGGGACVVGDVVEIEPLSPLADPEAYATRLVSDERGYIFSPGGEGTGPEGDDEARAAVAVPVLSYGSLVRLVQDMATLAPPFSCGPCVTRACIENERAESAMAYLGWMERRARGVVA